MVDYVHRIADQYVGNGAYQLAFDFMHTTPLFEFKDRRFGRTGEDATTVGTISGQREAEFATWGSRWVALAAVGYFDRLITPAKYALTSISRHSSGARPTVRLTCRRGNDHMVAFISGHYDNVWKMLFDAAQNGTIQWSPDRWKNKKKT